MRQSGDVFEIRIVGLDIFVEVLNDEADEARPVLRKVDDLLAKVNASTDPDDDVFNEVVAVAKALVLEQLGLAVLDLD